MYKQSKTALINVTKITGNHRWSHFFFSWQLYQKIIPSQLFSLECYRFYQSSYFQNTCERIPLIVALEDTLLKILENSQDYNVGGVRYFSEQQPLNQSTKFLGSLIVYMVFKQSLFVIRWYLRTIPGIFENAFINLITLCFLFVNSSKPERCGTFFFSSFWFLFLFLFAFFSFLFFFLCFFAVTTFLINLTHQRIMFFSSYKTSQMIFIMQTT